MNHRLAYGLICCGLGALSAWSAPGTSSVKFDSTLSLLGITFHVECPNRPEGNDLTITPSGLAGDNAPANDRIDGTVMGAQVADLNSDGSPEVYVYIRSGPDARGSVVAYSANQRKSLSRIFVPDLSADPKVAEGYSGSDGYAVVGKTFVRSFPIGGGRFRKIEYKLVPGEAAWRLQAERVTEN